MIRMPKTVLLLLGVIIYLEYVRDTWGSRRNRRKIYCVPSSGTPRCPVLTRWT